jgi:nitroreductase
MSPDRPPSAGSPAPDPLAGITGRRSTSRLAEPAPADAELTMMLAAAATAPDHGLLRPWRAIVLRGAALDRLGAAFAEAHRAREPDCRPEDHARTAGKPRRAPVIVAVVARVRPHPKIPEWEQLVTAGCAAQNLCLAAHALGYGSMWRTGWYGEEPIVRDHLGLADHEQVVGWLYLGTPDGPPPLPRPDPDLAARVTWRG